MSLVLKSIMVFIAALAAFAPAAGNNLNPVINVMLQPLVYDSSAQPTTVGSVLGALSDAAGGRSEDVRTDWTARINEMVGSGLSMSRRVRLVSGSNGEAAYVAMGRITRVTTTSKKEKFVSRNDKGKLRTTEGTRYDAAIWVSLSLTDVISGYSYKHDFAVSAHSSGAGSTADKALAAALNNLGWEVREYCNRIFPLRANIVKKGVSPDGRLVDLYIDLGTDSGVTSGMHFAVRVVFKAGGKEDSTEIGRIKVSRVTGGGESVCKVVGGHSVILRAISEKADIIAISQD